MIFFVTLLTNEIKLRITSNAHIYELIHLIWTVIFFTVAIIQKKDNKTAEFISVTYINT